jgi:hypothetical protein
LAPVLAWFASDHHRNNNKMADKGPQGTPQGALVAAVDCRGTGAQHQGPKESEGSQRRHHCRCRCSAGAEGQIPGGHRRAVPCPRQGSRGTAVALQLSPSDIWGLLRRDICSLKSRTSKAKTPLGTYLRAMGMRVLKGHVAACIWPRQQTRQVKAGGLPSQTIMVTHELVVARPAAALTRPCLLRTAGIRGTFPASTAAHTSKRPKSRRSPF